MEFVERLVFGVAHLNDERVILQEVLREAGPALLNLFNVSGSPAPIGAGSELPPHASRLFPGQPEDPLAKWAQPSGS